MGSLLRPPLLVAARERFAANEISRDELRLVEDEAVRASVRSDKKTLGLLATTDGEFRRAAWHTDFISALGGVVRAPGNRLVHFENEHEKIEFTPDAFKIEGRVHLPNVIFEDAFRFLAGVVDTSMPKVTIPSPAMVHFRGGDPALGKDRTTRTSKSSTAISQLPIARKSQPSTSSAVVTCNSTTRASRC